MSGMLEGKVAVITGGASGMGLATVERFIAEGAKVVFADLPAKVKDDLVARIGEEKAAMHHTRREPGGPNDGIAIADRLGVNATFVPCDVTDAEQLENAIDTAVSRYGGLDILFNNAGIGGAEGSIVDCPDHVFDRVVDVDLKAVWRGIKLAAPRMAERGGGSIISTASIAAIMGFPGLAAYGAAKAGVTALTRVAAVELAAQNIRVNAILPGGIVTPILYDSPLSPQSFDPDMLRVGMSEMQPLRRAGEGADIAGAALWLASDDSSFVTGQSIQVDGGFTIQVRSGGLGGSTS
jgi:NAD(P)-dependent dehydrogenase (short-subunit alcohol dehydrogenase family)